MDSRRETAFVYLGFKKAFSLGTAQKTYRIPETKWNKMQNTGWINEFLLIRRQRVVINDSRFEWRGALSGIPQVFVLGPVLFVISINSMPNTFKSKLYLFADNAKLSKKNTSEKVLELLQEGLRKPEDWSENSIFILMKINVYIR